MHFSDILFRFKERSVIDLTPIHSLQRCAIDFDKKAEKGKQRFFQEIYITSPFFSLSKWIISRKVPNKANSDSQATIQFLHFDRKIHRYSFTGTSEYKLISLRRNCFLYRFGRSPTVRRTSFFPFPFFSIDETDGRNLFEREREKFTIAKEETWFLPPPFSDHYPR